MFEAFLRQVVDAGVAPPAAPPARPVAVAA
jgi:hypothetical protein